MIGPGLAGRTKFTFISIVGANWSAGSVVNSAGPIASSRIAAKKAALDGAVRVTELRSSRVLNADVAGLKVERLPAEQRSRRRRFDEPVGGGPEDIEAGHMSSRGHCADRPLRKQWSAVTSTRIASCLASPAM